MPDSWIFVAVDLGLNSPGVCIWDPDKPTLEWHVMAQYDHPAQRTLIGSPIRTQMTMDPAWFLPRGGLITKKKKEKKKDEDIKLNKSTLTFTDPYYGHCDDKPTNIGIPAKSSSIHCFIHVHGDLVEFNSSRCNKSKKKKQKTESTTDEKRRPSLIRRQVVMIDAVVRIIKQYALTRPQHGVVIGVEHYPIHMARSDQVSQTCEIGGMFRAKVVKHGWWYWDVNPSTIKKHFAGGAADKLDMWKQFQQYKVLPTSLYTMLRFDTEDDRLVRDPSKLYQKVKKRKKPQKDADPLRKAVVPQGYEKDSERKVHKPIEDMVDSFALILCTVYEWNHLPRHQQALFSACAISNTLIKYVGIEIGNIIQEYCIAKI